MSRESAKSSGPKATTSDSARRKPVDAAVFKRAGKIATRYRLTLDCDDVLGYVGSAVELPTVFVDGPTAEKCVQATREALSLAIATMIECGQNPPLPLSSGKRDTQVNVRLAQEEKLLLKEAARRFGFKGISDFIRTVALGHPSRI